MPDFADALELHLRRAAAEAARAPRVAPATVPTDPRGTTGRSRPRWVPRPIAAAGSLALVAVVVVLALVWGGSGPNTAPAFGEPLALRAPLVDLPPAAEPGASARRILGPSSAAITQGHEIPTADGPAYLYGNAAGQCLSAPDPAVPDPALERGVSCVTTETFRRFGISISLVGADGGTYFAAIPQGVRNPTVREGSGPARELRPTGFGVVAVRTTGTTTVTLFDRAGRGRQDTVARPIPATRRVPSSPATPQTRTAPGP